MSDKPRNTNQGAFYLTPEVSEALRSADLTAAEWRVWSYLVVLEPHGIESRSFTIPEIMDECNVSKSTAYKALGKLQETGLFEIKAQGLSFRRVTEVEES